MLSVQVRCLLEALWKRQALPPSVERRARQLLLDTLGCAIAGFAAPELQALAGRLSQDGRGLVLPGLSARLEARSAALMIGAAACWDEACEGLARAHGRPGLHTVPAVLALALRDGNTLGQSLLALTAGFEAAGRLGEVLRIQPGMHVDGTWGAFGAATGAAMLAGLSAGQAFQALNAVACGLPCSLYLPIRRGALNRNLYAGQAAARAMEAVDAVASGIGAPADGLDEMARLLFRLDPAAVTLHPAHDDLILEGYFKSLAGVRHAHYPASAAIEWHHANPGAAGSIQAIRIQTYPEAITYCSNRAPGTAIQAQFSLSWCTAWGLANGTLEPPAFRPEALSNQLLRRLEAVVEISIDPALERAGARGASLEVITPGGASIHVCRQVPGDPGLAMDEAALSAKFMRFAGPLIGAPAASAICEKLLTLPLGTPLAECISG